MDNTTQEENLPTVTVIDEQHIGTIDTSENNSADDINGTIVAIETKFDIASATLIPQTVTAHLLPAFSQYVRLIFTNLAENNEPQRPLQNRRMATVQSQLRVVRGKRRRLFKVTLREQSFSLNYLHPCPPFTTTLLSCQTLEGRYDMIVTNDSEDYPVDAVKDTYTDATLMGISDGSFAEIVTEVMDPENHSNFVILSVSALDSPSSTAQSPHPPPSEMAAAQKRDSESQQEQDEGISSWLANVAFWGFLVVAFVVGCLGSFLIQWILVSCSCCIRNKMQNDSDNDDSRCNDGFPKPIFNDETDNHDSLSDADKNKRCMDDSYRNVPAERHAVRPGMDESYSREFPLERHAVRPGMDESFSGAFPLETHAARPGMDDSYSGRPPLERHGIMSSELTLDSRGSNGSELPLQRHTPLLGKKIKSERDFSQDFVIENPFVH